MKNVVYNEREFETFDVVGEHVLIKKIQNNDLRQVNGIYIPKSSAYENMRMGAGQVLDITEEAEKKYGIKKDDYVIFDFYACHGNFKDLALINAESILLKMSEEEIFKFVNSELS